MAVLLGLAIVAFTVFLGIPHNSGSNTATLIVIFLGFFPIFYIYEEYLITTNKSVKDTYNELNSRKSPSISVYVNFGAKIPEHTENKTILEIPRSKHFRFLGKDIFEFKTTKEIPDKFAYINTYKNNAIYAESQMIFKKEKNGTELLSKTYSSNRRSLLAILSSLTMNKYLRNMYEECNYNIKKASYKTYFRKPNITHNANH